VDNGEKMMRKEELCAKSRYYPCEFLEEVTNPMKISVRTADLLPKIRTQVLPNMKQEC
jgi:hypothetical protein